MQLVSLTPKLKFNTIRGEKAKLKKRKGHRGRKKKMSRQSKKADSHDTSNAAKEPKIDVIAGVIADLPGTLTGADTVGDIPADAEKSKLENICGHTDVTVETDDVQDQGRGKQGVLPRVQVRKWKKLFKNDERVALDANGEREF